MGPPGDESEEVMVAFCQMSVYVSQWRSSELTASEELKPADDVSVAVVESSGTEDETDAGEVIGKTLPLEAEAEADAEDEMVDCEPVAVAVTCVKLVTVEVTIDRELEEALPMTLEAGAEVELNGMVE